jgi:tetratricopeptide (TPR) repeat protein
MTRTRIALILVLLIVGGFVAFQHYQVAKEEEAQQRAMQAAREASIRLAQARQERARLEAENAARQPHPDLGLVSVPVAYPRRAPAWESAEKNFYETLLSNGRFEVLVVPFQVQDYALDRTSRSLMTAELALAISATGKKVPDPYLVARALGEGERRLNSEDVYRLAGKLGVDRIVWGYVGHNRENEMRITMQYQDRAAGITIAQAPLKFRHLEKIVFSDDDPPIEVFRRGLPDVLGAAGFAAAAGDSPVPESRFEDTGLPRSPLGMLSDKAEPARDARYLQLLAALTPASEERARERFNEKSMLQILRMSPTSPDYGVLKARALMQMGLRPAALKTLGTPKSIEEKHLFAMLNGNLPDAQRYASQIGSGAKAFTAQLELNDIATTYGARSKEQSLKAAEALKLPGDAWRFLAIRSFTDWDVWSQFENIQLKALLDQEFPVVGFTAEGIVRGAASLGDLRNAQVAMELSVLDHVRKLLGLRPADWCCTSVDARLTQRDFLDLFEAIGADNVVRRARFLAGIQGNPSGALEYIAGIESAYKDYPQIQLQRANAERLMAERLDGTAKEGFSISSNEHTFDVFFWEQGQTRIAASAWGLDSMVNRYGYFDNFYAGDYPFRPYYPSWQAGGQVALEIASEEAGLRNSAFDFSPVPQLSWFLGEFGNDWGRVDDLLKSIAGRFEGNPHRPILLAKNSARKNDIVAAERYYREGIRAQPAYWQAYVDLGTLLLENGEVAKSAQLFGSYPGFSKGSGMNSVAISNGAFEAGSLFYWSGNFLQAVPLYRIAADLDTGSDASMASRIRLDLMNRDYLRAMLGSRERAVRYNSEYGYRDYLGLMHATGHSKEAWDAFDLLIGKFDKPEIWETALVGHRLAGATEPEIAAWAAQDRVRVVGGTTNSYAAMYLLRAGVTDRMPSAGLEALIASVERPVWQLSNHNQVVRGSLDGQSGTLLGPERTSNSVLPLGVFQESKKTRVKSDYLYFAEAYRLMRSGDFSGAKSVFDEAFRLYDLTNVKLSYMLPYYAYAAAKAGTAQSAETLLAKFTPAQHGFDYYLAQAAVTGLEGKTDESLQALNLALLRRPFTRFRPVYTEYQFAEICEWLYGATRTTKYRDAALSWAKKVQAFSPWFAWAYAMEAKLSTNAGDRHRAIAMAYYLDRNSERLSAIPKKEINAAVREFAGRNPFLNLKPRNSARDSSV